MTTVDAPMISVIIPTYNRIKTLPRAITSVLNQTYQDIELIIVDDGSSDGTEEYVLGLRDERIRYIKNERNLGPSATRNKGVEYARGKYIAFQDSDDEWKLEKLEKQMKVMMNASEPVQMVYSEMEMYDGNNNLYLIVPSRAVDVCNKRGDLFSYLLLNALIGTPTVLIERQAFLREGGFNSQLHSYEDWEFFLRFSQNHRIGFVEEPLIKVHYSPDSVNQRYPERIRTQMYMMKEMLAQLRERGMLRTKLEAIQYEAHALKCYSTFIEEWYNATQLFTAEEKEQFELVVRGAAKESIQKNNIKVEAEEKIENMKEAIINLFESVVAEKDTWVGKTLGALKECLDRLQFYGKLFGIGDLQDSEYRIIKSLLDKDTLSQMQKMQVLEKVATIIEKIQKYINENKHTCNVCGKTVFFDPIPKEYENIRKKAGFSYWDEKFQLESRFKYSCPVCSANDRDRLMIAFLESLQSDDKEKLRMLQIAPSRTIEFYALGREDIVYDSTDMTMKDVSFNANLQDLSMIEDETYDIVVCLHALERVEDDRKAMREIWRILKLQGVCLVCVSLAVGKNETDEQWGCPVEENWRRFGHGAHSRFYGQEDFVNRLQHAGFCVNELGVTWFGSEFYQKHGFDDLSVLYVVTKGFCLI